MSSTSSTRQRKKRRRSGGNGSNNGGSSSVSLLVRLSEACAKHKEYHRENDHKQLKECDENYGGDEIPDRCRKDLKHLRIILPEVEKKYIVSPSNLVSAQDVSHICAFYRIVVMGGFCPHSMVLLNDDSNNHEGQQILPRVHQLLRHLCFDPVKSQCIHLLSKTETTKETIIADEIAVTAAMLLQQIHDSNHHNVLLDMIILLFDLSTLAVSDIISPQSYMYENDIKTDNGGYQVLIFNETLNNNDLDKNMSAGSNTTTHQSGVDGENSYRNVSFPKYPLEITSFTTLLMLQIAMQKVLLTLLGLDHQKRREEKQQIQDSDWLYSIPTQKKDQKNIPNIPPSRYKTASLADNLDLDAKLALISSIRQILFFLPPILQLQKKQDFTLEILTMRNKITSAKLLSFLLRDFIVHEVGINQQKIYMEVMAIVTRTVYIHISSISNTHTSDSDSESKTYQINVSEYFSSCLSTLLKKIIISPPLHANGGDSVRINTRDIYTLLDCLPSIQTIVSSTSPTLFHSTKCLCRMILRSLHTFLHGVQNNKIFTNLSPSNTPYPSTYRSDMSHETYLKHRQDDVITHCSINGLIPYLFELATEPSVTSIATSIILVLLRNQNKVDIVCAMKITFQSFEENQLNNAPISTTNHSLKQTDESNFGNKRVYSRMSKRLRLTGDTPQNKTKNLEQTNWPQLKIDQLNNNSTQKNKDTIDRINQSDECEKIFEEATQKPSSKDTSFAACLLLLMDEALNIAKSIHQKFSELTSQNNNQNENSLEMDMLSTISVRSLNKVACALLIIDAYYVINIIKRPVGLDIIRKYVFSALFYISERIFIESSQLVEDDSRRWKKVNLIMEILLQVGFRIASVSNGYLGDQCTGQLLDSISKLTTKGCSMNYPLESTNKMARSLTSAQLPHRSYFELPVLTGEQKDSFSRFQIEHTDCNGLCKDLLLKFGSHSLSHEHEEKQCNCLCSLITSNSYFAASHGKNLDLRYTQPFDDSDVFFDECTLFLFEETLTIKNRFMLFSSIQPFASKRNFLSNASYNGKVSDLFENGSSIAEMCKIFDKPSNLPTDIVSSVIAYLPTMFISLSLLGLAERHDSVIHSTRSTLETKKIMNRFIGDFQSNLMKLFDLFPFKEIYGPLVSQIHSEGNNSSLIVTLCSSMTDLLVLFMLFKDEVDDKHCQFIFGNTNVIHRYRVIEIQKLTKRFLFFMSLQKQSENFVYSNRNTQRYLKRSNPLCDLILYELGYLTCTNNSNLFDKNVRLSVWKLIDVYCRVSSLSTLQEIRTERSNISTVETDIMRNMKTNSNVNFNVEQAFIWFLRAPFADEDAIIRSFAAHRIGEALLSHKAKLILSLFLKENEYKSNEINIEEKNNGPKVDCWTNKKNSIFLATIPRLFSEIDNLLFKHCHIDQSQLSFTAAGVNFSNVSFDKKEKPSYDESSTNVQDILQRQISAVTSISGICQNANPDTCFGRELLQNCLIRLIRFWVAPTNNEVLNQSFSINETIGQLPYDNGVVSSVAFEEINRLHDIYSLGEIITKTCRETFVPALFCEILVPTNSLGQSTTVLQPKSLERNYRYLLTFIQRYLMIGIDNVDAINHSTTSFSDVAQYADNLLPLVVPALIIEKDYESLRITVGFKAYLLSENNRSKRESLTHAIEKHLIGYASKQIKHSSKIPGIITSNRDLNRYTKDLCIAKVIVGKIIVKLLLHPDRSPIVFFLKTVLQSSHSLKMILRMKADFVLKSLILKVSETIVDQSFDSQSNEFAAVKKGALILKPDWRPRKFVVNKNTKDPKKIHSFDGFDALDVDISKTEAYDAARDWVSSNFMLLFVNLVLDKWKKDALEEKISAIRILFVIVKLLKPEESSQYFTQVMSMINVAMSLELSSVDSLSFLRLLAVSCLDQFVRVVLSLQFQVIGSNLATIVVSLFPILVHDSKPTDSFHSQSSDLATKLLEHLVTGQNDLAFYFHEIPFLPFNPCLDRVRQLLKERGVDVDNLMVFTQMTSDSSQNRQSSRESLGSRSQSGGDTAKINRPFYSSQQQAAMRRRLTILRNLLHHESCSVRQVVLNHITDLLRANRSIFHRIFKNEENSSMHFLTVVKQDISLDEDRVSVSIGDVCDEVRSDYIRNQQGNGSVASLIQGLLNRCKTELDTENRIALAICLGEIGAIDPKRLPEEVYSSNDLSVTISCLDPNGYLSKWRSQNPPWRFKSAHLKYMLKLVTKHLVSALRASSTAMELNKISFTIQEVLTLMDQCAKNCSNSPSSDQIASKDKDHLQSGNNYRGQMSTWLEENLKAESIYEVLETFWDSDFQQNDKVESKKPPFFENSSSYHSWIADWSRYMVEKANICERSRWKKLFFAFRSALRSPSAIDIVEFLLPLLVLDRICYGCESEKKVTIHELRSALSLEISDSEESTTKWSSYDSTKVVSVALMTLDTLHHWAETEIESRSKHLRGDSKISSHGSTIESLSIHGSEFEWDAEESVAYINDLKADIPLSLRANAAALVGMHAKALQLLEQEGRSFEAEEIYDAIVSVDEKTESNEKTHQKLYSRFHLEGTNLVLVHKVLGELNDLDSMKSLARFCDRKGTKISFLDQIREKEICGDWVGALHAYEQALQIEGGCKVNNTYSIVKNKEKTILEKGLVRTLLELGQLETALNQAKGIIYEGESSTFRNDKEIQLEGGFENCRAHSLVPSAVEAAWRLGRWSVLDNLLEMSSVGEKIIDHNLNNDDRFQMYFASAMLGLHKKSIETVTSSVFCARKAVMTSLGTAVAKSYAKVYPLLTRLHCLREVENAAEILCSSSKHLSEEKTIFATLAITDSNDAWSWDGRLELVASDFMGYALVANSRLALTRIAKETLLEGSLLFSVGKKARKNGLFSVASSALIHAELAFAQAKDKSFLQSDVNIPGIDISSVNQFKNNLNMQLAKLKHLTGQPTAALQLLGIYDEISTLICQDEQSIKNALDTIHGKDSSVLARKILQTTEWMVEGGLKGGTEAMEMYRLVKKILPEWERAHFCFGRYLDNLLESRIVALTGQANQQSKGQPITDDDFMRNYIVSNDPNCQKYLLFALEEYLDALTLGQKHVFQALPRLLTLWFDFTSTVGEDDESSKEKNTTSTGKSPAEKLSENQYQASKLVHERFKKIPPISFYTAMPQLISNLWHSDQNTSTLVLNILKRVLTKFPAQAMWSLAYLRNSMYPDRCKVGEKIFQGAQANLRKSEDLKMHDLLVTSKSLFSFLIGLAKHNPKSPSARSMSVRPWKGDIELSEFMPPVQAALSTSRLDVGRENRSNDVFPQFVPKMRTFSSQVQVMASKAKPKKLTAYAVPGTNFRRHRSSVRSVSKDERDGDIGEMHFLVKREAKGDLRKDARVQDLNNVINRLFAGSSALDDSMNGHQYYRRLHLRTFSVVCLSEECGIIEWVPQTDSFRNLISSSYNPQAKPHSNRRRGRRLANFADPALRSAFQKSQDAYVKSGNLTLAAKLFEEKCLREFPPVFYWWFVHEFKDAHRWFEARTNFTLSAAAWSAVGHVIGLGDRHSENLLVDKSCGECVHVDFDCIFDKGLQLPRPEVIPFRLTPNMLDAFGPSGAEGTFSGGLITAMKTLRDNRDILLSVLEPFLKDPVIDWKRQRNQQKAQSESADAKRSIKIIDGRLKGIYNLKNPNYKKIRRIDVHSIDEDDMSHILPMSVEGQVQKMITEATSHENLVQLYVGWMPWL